MLLKGLELLFVSCHFLVATTGTGVSPRVCLCLKLLVRQIFKWMWLFTQICSHFRVCIITYSGLDCVRAQKLHFWEAWLCDLLQHRISAWLGWAGPLISSHSTPSNIPGCSKPLPTWPRMLPGMGHCDFPVMVSTAFMPRAQQQGMKLIQCHFAQLILIYSFITDRPVWLDFKPAGWLSGKKIQENLLMPLIVFSLAWKWLTYFQKQCWD